MQDENVEMVSSHFLLSNEEEGTGVPVANDGFL